MTSRRAFLAGLAALAAPLFARLALPAAPARKLLGKHTSRHRGITINGCVGTLQVSLDGGKNWQDCGTVTALETTTGPALVFMRESPRHGELYRAVLVGYRAPAVTFEATLLF
jgi:hypothetical protein